jgi:hypothetical protein
MSDPSIAEIRRLLADDTTLTPSEFGRLLAEELAARDVAALDAEVDRSV